MKSGWRKRAQDVIAPILQAHLAAGQKDARALRRDLRAAYPFRMRKYWPYRVWLEEVRQAVAILTGGYYQPGRRQHVVDPRQGRLFEE